MRAGARGDRARSAPSRNGSRWASPRTTSRRSRPRARHGAARAARRGSISGRHVERDRARRRRARRRSRSARGRCRRRAGHFVGHRLHVLDQHEPRGALEVGTADRVLARVRRRTAAPSRHERRRPLAVHPISAPAGVRPTRSASPRGRRQRVDARPAADDASRIRRAVEHAARDAAAVAAGADHRPFGVAIQLAEPRRELGERDVRGARPRAPSSHSRSAPHVQHPVAAGLSDLGGPRSCDGLTRQPAGRRQPPFRPSGFRPSFSYPTRAGASTASSMRSAIRMAAAAASSGPSSVPTHEAYWPSEAARGGAGRMRRRRNASSLRVSGSAPPRCAAPRHVRAARAAAASGARRRARAGLVEVARVEVIDRGLGHVARHLGDELPRGSSA